MAQHRKFTPLIVPQIVSWLNEGWTPSEIAEKIGCTVGTLRVRCSQLGISLRHRTNNPPSGARGGAATNALGKLTNRTRVGEVRLEGQELLVLVPELAVDHLRACAATKGLSESDLAAILLEKIAQDDLYDAVLDEG
jgi:hypothetical protein